MPRNAKKRPAAAAALVKHILFALVLVVAAGCSGSGCGSGCSSCSGVTPLAGDFDANKRIENAGSVRITPSGLNFLQTNFGALAQGILGASATGGVLSFAVPATPGSMAGISYNLCPNGANATSSPKICTAEIDLGNAALTITPSSPTDLHITGTLPIRVEDVQAQIDLAICNPTINVALDGDKSCPGGTFQTLPLDVDIAIHVDQNQNQTARFGYTQVSINQIIDETALESSLTSDVQICGNPSCDVLCCAADPCTCALAAITDWSPVKQALVNAVVPQLDTTLKATLDGQLCQKATAAEPCPVGTTADSSMICRYNNDPTNSCASIILGTQGHMNVGTLLQSVSAGTQGPLDFLFAAGGPHKNTSDATLSWGDLDPVDGGATLGMFGGAEANPLSKCVPISTLALPMGIPIPDELLGTADTLSDWPAGVRGPDVEIALNERFTNYALNNLYNSGALCIGISTESIPQLSSGTLGLLAPSVKTLGLQEEPQQVAIAIRPSSPPAVTFGNGTNLTTDPVLLVTLKQASLDFYIFSLDRFIRFMTATYDLSVPVNLTVSKAGLTPVIDTIGVSNGVVTNSKLLVEPPSTLASALGGLLGSLVGQQLSGSLKAFDINSSLSSLGLQLYIPETVTGMGSPGLRKLSKGADNYLGIFAAFELPGMTLGPRAIPVATHTDVQVVHKAVDPAGLELATLRDDNVPVVDLVAESNLDDGTRAVEYQYKIDEGFWHPFAASRFITVRDPWLRVQGRHVIYVRSRAVGVPASLDEAPAEAEVTIDADPPSVSIEQVEGGAVKIAARDRVTADPMVRYRLGEGAWSSWILSSHLPPAIPAGDATVVRAEAQDNDGNIGTAAQPVIRGDYDGAAAACNCTVTGDDPGHAGQALFLLGITLAGISVRRSRRQDTVHDGAASGPKPRPPVEAKTAYLPTKASMKRTIAGLAAIAVASSWAGCSCNKAPTTQAGSTSGGCGGSCTELQPGLIGEYASAAVNGSDIWVAGYSEADWENGNSYGDLVAGKWNGTSVDWDQVDGVPSTPAVDPTQYDVHGFRGGQTASGPDVGLWTSIAIGSDGNPAIAYYDRTNQALKFAQLSGTGTWSWSTQTVDSVPGGTAGRYAKMIFVGGNFVIAYQSISPGGASGALISKVRVATSAGLTPTATTWTFEDAATLDTTPCRASFCTSSQVCLTTGQCVTPLAASQCAPACSSSQACTGNPAACVGVLDSTKLDAYPSAIGDYTTLAPDGQGGFGIAYYDRPHGNLVTARKSGSAWVTTIVDGEGAAVPSGDAGIGANLFIDSSGDWHIAYVNGYSEALQYIRITKGKTALAPEIIDDGLGIGGTPNTDGQHLVGDDAHVLVTAGGEVQVTYQDSTAGTLHYAVGTPAAKGHTWQVQAIQQDGFAGAFSSIVVAGGQTQLLNWWRTGANHVAGDVRILTPP